MIREDTQIKSLKMRGEEYKLQAFADDFVFILENPIDSVIQLLKTLQDYGQVTGLKINFNKTKILTKNMTK